MASLFQALHYAHQHGVVHGDLHPRNVLFTTGEKLVVANFRFSSLAQVAGMAYPSSAYQAPEQRWGDLDARSDQFSLSWLAYTLLTGYRPVLTSLSNSESSHTPASTQSRVAARDYDLALPAYLGEALLRARAEEPQLRYPTILAFLCALRLEPADGMNAPVFPEGEGSERGADHLARQHVLPSPDSSADTHLQILEVAQPSDQKAMFPVASAMRSSVATVSKQEMSRRTNDTGPLIPAQACPRREGRQRLLRRKRESRPRLIHIPACLPRYLRLHMPVLSLPRLPPQAQG